jgi:hypothetical protein
MVALYGTCEVQTNPPGIDGQLAGDLLTKPVLSVTVTRSTAKMRKCSMQERRGGPWRMCLKSRFGCQME